VAGLTRRHGDVVALDDVSLDVAEGELLTVVGPSGSGKSTLLRLVAGLDEPDAGSVAVGGRDLAGVPPAGRGVAMVFQGFALFPHLTVAENVGFGLRARGTPAAETRARVEAAAAALGLGALLDRRPAALSGGERQRAALARALAARPRVLLLDEPLSNLDAPLRAQARAVLREVHAQTGATVVHVTHDQAEALTLGRRVAVLAAGRLEQVGPPDEVYARPATRFVAGFLGRRRMNLVDAAAAGPLAAAAPDGRAAAGATLGVRPEDLVPRDGGAVRARVEVVERAGHEEVWRVRADGLDAPLWVRPPTGVRAREGDGVALDPVRVHVFGPDGRRTA